MSAELAPSAAALATAGWWADHAFRGTVGDHGGDGATMALAVLAGAQGRPADGSKREAFVAALASRVDARLARAGDFGVTLATDYGPEPPLCDVADETGVAGGSFPWKSMTVTYATHATASLGYGATSRLIWQDPAWERPVCGQGKWGDHDREPWTCSAPRYHDGDHTFDVPDPLCAGTIEGFGGKPSPCLRPARHEWHRLDGDYVSTLAHTFTPGAAPGA